MSRIKPRLFKHVGGEERKMKKENAVADAGRAEIYGYSTKRFNEQVKYNIDRFDEDFRFQLKKEEVSCLISEIPTSKRGGTRKLPYALPSKALTHPLIEALGNEYS